jgi:FixJ family two-component response regulator
VAVVDDDDGLREAIQSLLGSEGFAARSFESAEAFLKSADAACCVIVDWKLPRMSGLDLLRCLRSIRNPVPVVIVSAWDDEARQAARQLHGPMGLVSFLRKPFAGEDLVRIVRSIPGCAHARPTKWRRGAS